MNFVPGKDAYVNSTYASAGDVNPGASASAKDKTLATKKDVNPTTERHVDSNTIAKGASLRPATRRNAAHSRGRNANSSSLEMDVISTNEPEEKERVYCEIPYIQRPAEDHSK